MPRVFKVQPYYTSNPFFVVAHLLTEGTASSKARDSVVMNSVYWIQPCWFFNITPYLSISQPITLSNYIDTSYRGLSDTLMPSIAAQYNFVVVFHSAFLFLYCMRLKSIHEYRNRRLLAAPSSSLQRNVIDQLIEETSLSQGQSRF